MVLRAYLICALFCHLCFGICYSSFAQNYPERIVSLGPSLTEELYLLGTGDKVVGVTTYCQRPSQAQTKEKIGTIKEVNSEKIVSLNPSIVLATSLTDPRVVEKLRNLGIRVVTFPATRDFKELCEQFLELGIILGREAQAKEIIHQIETRVDIIKERIKNLPQPKVFVQIGAKPLFTANSDYFINDFIEFAGGVNIAKDAKTGLYSREEVLRKNPDIIIIATMGIVGEEERTTWQKYKTLNATKDNRIYIVDSYKLCNATPVSFVETLEEVERILHPEKVQDE